jgi:hypothetical protein
MEEHGEQKEGLKGTTKKFWGATRKGIHVATFRANKYKQIVQKKIDLASLHKKIPAAYADLGKLIDECWEADETDILANEKVQALFQKLEDLKHAAAGLEEEIEAIKAEAPLEEEEAEKKEETKEEEKPTEEKMPEEK